MKKKNIILGIIDPCDFTNKSVSGGSSGFLVNIIPYLNMQRTIIFGIGLNNTIPWKTYRLEENIDFIPICKLKFSPKIPMRLKVLIFYFRYRKRILNSKVDVLYIHMPECCLPFLKNNKKIPIIYQKHGSTNPVSFSKFYFGRAFLFKKFFDYALNLIYKHAQWIIAIDSATHQTVLRSRKNKGTSLLMNAVDINKFFPNEMIRWKARRRFLLKEHDYAILFVGRIEKTKGPKLLLDCIPWLKEREFPFHIFFAGVGSYQTYLENYAMKKKYNKWITFLGHVPYEVLPSFYNMSDVLVLPSETEGVPMVVLESLACGTPVVASNVGGIPDIVINGANGIVIDDPSPEKLSSAIIHILSKKLSWKDVSKSVEDHSMNSFIESLDDIISNVVN